MKKRSVTIKDVAKKAGVGVGTVSRVLNNNPHVNPKTKEHVLKVIHELGYIPNPHARRLSSGHTKIITTIFPQMVGEFHQLLLSGIDKVFEKEGYTSFVYPLYSENRYKFVQEKNLLLIPALFDRNQNFRRLFSGNQGYYFTRK